MKKEVSNKKAIITIIVVIILLVVLAGVYVYLFKNNTWNAHVTTKLL